MCKLFRAAMGLLMVCALTKAAIAQNTTGNITGTVMDASGAVVAGATVVAHNLATGVDTPAVTNQSGAYAIRFLSIGQYEVSVTATGFGGQKFQVFTLEQNQVAKFDAKLTVGDVSVVANVNADVAPILNTNDASLGMTLSANEIQNIPLNGRNFSSVTLFQPGAINTDPVGMTGNNAIERNTFNNGIASINGNRNQANNYTLDGADQNEPQNNLIAYNPAPDSLAEVHVVTSNAPAQYGNANGGAIASILKSGSNQFHGSAYAFLQNENLNANSWSNKHQINSVTRNPYTQTIFGGTIGGPILHDRLFFFGDYEGARSHTGGTQEASVLTAAMRQGDFSALLPTTQLYDPQNNFTPFQNNAVPVINPVAKYLFAHPEFYPLPNAAPQDGLLQNNFQGPQRSFVHNNQADGKIDWSATATNKFTAFYAQSNAGDTQTAVIPVFFPAQNVYPTKLGGGSWIHTFSSAVVNEARFGFTRVRWDNSIPTDPSGAFGLNGNALVGIPFGAQQYVGFSAQSIGNNTSTIGNSANVQVIRDNTFNYYDNLTWQHGRQLFSFGVQATRYQQNYINTANFGLLGNFAYNGSFTSNPALKGAGGYSPADFVLDRVNNTQIGSPEGLVGNRQWRAAGYIQDDWKATDKLTINIGLRYQYDQPWYEVNNKTANVLLDTGTPIYAGSIPSGAPANSQLCPTRACYNPTYTQIMPRLGFAYQAAPRFVIRGGYGATSFFEGNAGNQRLTSSPPFVLSSNVPAVDPKAGISGTPLSIEQGFATSFGAASGFGAWPQNMRAAYISEYSLTTEFALTNKTSLSVGYVGESGQHLITYRNANQLTSPTATAGPYDALVGAGQQLLLTESNGMMNYNAGQASLRQRVSHGLEGMVSYTYARAMTNSSGNYGTPGVSGSNGAFQDGYNGHADYGPAGQDIRHSVNGLLVYALPFGRGQAFGGGMNRYLDLLAGGWKISATGLLYTGFPITMNAPSQISVNSLGTARANQYRHLKIVNRSVENWWGTDPSAVPCASGVDNGVCAYGIPAANTFGTAAVNTERAPGYHQLDLSTSKDFHITDSQSFGFRANFYNVLNVVSLSNPDNGISDVSFGEISGTRSQERRIEFSGHYQF